MRAWAKQFSSAPNSVILLFSYTMLASVQTLCLIPAKPTGILTQRTTSVNISKALNVELEWDTIKHAPNDI